LEEIIVKKNQFIALLGGTVGGLLFALGMCMCLLSEWNAFRPGVICTAIGALMLLIQSIVLFFRSGRKIRINWKIAARVLYGILSALVLGVGMCLVLVWHMMLPGIAVGIAGIVMLLMLIPMCVGLK
jgi:hypothetical protein